MTAYKSLRKNVTSVTDRDNGAGAAGKGLELELPGRMPDLWLEVTLGRRHIVRLSGSTGSGESSKPGR